MLALLDHFHIDLLSTLDLIYFVLSAFVEEFSVSSFADESIFFSLSDELIDTFIVLNFSFICSLD